MAPPLRPPATAPAGAPAAAAAPPSKGLRRRVACATAARHVHDPGQDRTEATSPWCHGRLPGQMGKGGERRAWRGEGGKGCCRAGMRPHHTHMHGGRVQLRRRQSARRVAPSMARIAGCPHSCRNTSRQLAADRGFGAASCALRPNVEAFWNLRIRESANPRIREPVASNVSRPRISHQFAAGVGSRPTTATRRPLGSSASAQTTTFLMKSVPSHLGQGEGPNRPTDSDSRLIFPLLLGRHRHGPHTTDASREQYGQESRLIHGLGHPTAKAAPSRAEWPP
ncbi:hypothetical protein BS50DRAFT_149951 [Corynespora cassiicola Philippines]|uniref:Uncharacterized protein n=1 Tax=Corynespora cassiicola Philippines TaxID=1448308 RepID=A0A2T2N8P5_CORCC|nr:hypothetical protein BS50DRAFT_149951 [Corynespora cassiicola Philippines]